MKYYVTFGVQYAHEQHPCTVDGVTPHPDGYVTVEAPSYDLARAVVCVAFGAKWCWLYDRLPSAEYFPRGELAVIGGAS